MGNNFNGEQQLILRKAILMSAFASGGFENGTRILSIDF